MKPGDKVKIIDVSDRPDLVLGSIRTVVQVSGPCVELDNSHETYTFTSITRLQLLPEETPPARPVKSGTQLAKVRDYVLAHGSVTLAELCITTGASEAAASARLRDLRAQGYEVTCSKVKGEKQRRYTVKSPEVATA